MISYIKEMKLFSTQRTHIISVHVALCDVWNLSCYDVLFTVRPFYIAM